MNDEVGNANFIGNAINKGLVGIPGPKKKKEKNTGKSEDKESTSDSETPTGKTPAATDVRSALKSGNISPLEAADLNPKGGLRPSAADVRSAYQGNKISYEEATDLNPSAKLTKPPIKVKSERIYTEKSKKTKVSKALGFDRYDIPTHGPGSEFNDNPNVGRQFRP